MIDVEAFQASELPARLAAGHATVAAHAAHGLTPLCLEVGDAVWSYVPRPDTVEVVAGVAPGSRRVIIDTDRFGRFVDELHTGVGLAYGGWATGRLDALIAWEPAIRAMYHGRPMYEPPAVDDASPYSFDADDDPLRLAAALSGSGFVHIRGVFDAAAVAALRDEIARLQALARPGDDRSWWATTSDGSEVCCRLTYVNERSELLGQIHEDRRVVSVVAAATPGLTVECQPDRHDGHSVVIKHADAATGLSDLPWHVDCGLGGHTVLCPAVNVGIQIDAATPHSGQLHFLVGSHRSTATHLSPDEITERGYPTVAVTTEPGDVTIHFTDTLHTAPPPAGVHTAPPPAGVDLAPLAVGRGLRRVLYATFHNPAAAALVPAGHGYNDVVLRSGDDNHVRNLTDMVG